jgi:hypothetical protein
LKHLLIHYQPVLWVGLGDSLDQTVAMNVQGGYFNNSEHLINKLEVVELFWGSGTLYNSDIIGCVYDSNAGPA